MVKEKDILRRFSVGQLVVWASSNQREKKEYSKELGIGMVVQNRLANVYVVWPRWKIVYPNDSGPDKPKKYNKPTLHKHLFPLDEDGKVLWS